MFPAERRRGGSTGGSLSGCHEATGSMTAELVVLAPILMLFALVALGLGRYELATGQTKAAASAAAAASAVADSQGAAQVAAVAAATSALGAPPSCNAPQISLLGMGFRPGGIVQATVTCHVRLDDLGLPGLPESAAAASTQLAAIDPFRAVSP